MRDTPVILVCYNRPWHTLQVLKALEQHGVRNLYIFSDAPRSEKEEIGVQQTRKLIQSIPWARPRIFLHKENQGCARSIVHAVSSVLENHDSMILLEDDCVPKKHYFRYVHECLSRYESNERVFGINGYNVPVSPERVQGYPYDVYFYKRIGSVGWATWKRAWRHFDPDLRKLYDRAIKSEIDLCQCGMDIPKQVQRVLVGQLDAWTLNWVLAAFLHDACYVYPVISQIIHLGWDGSGTHCTDSSVFKNTHEEAEIVRFPERIVFHEPLVDNYNNYFGNPKNHRRQQAKVVPEKRQRQKLNIIHINTHDRAGGAAKVAWRLTDSQCEAGHEANMLVGIKKSKSPRSCAFDVAERKDLKREGLQYYHFQGSHNLIQNEQIRRADIVHLHNLHGDYFNPFSLSALSHNKPLVWTLHDMQSITGHCAHSFECKRWRNGCGQCPDLTIDPAISVDATAQLWQDKKRIYECSYLNIVTPSNWLKNKVTGSILRNHSVHVIPNGVDTRIFEPCDKTPIRRQLGIPDGVVAIGAVANGSTLSNPWKGCRYTLEALQSLSHLHKNWVFVNIGGEGGNFGPRVINVAHIKDEKILAQVYSALDFFLYTPVADNCPLVVLEALACGVPLVTFSVGGVPELVKDGQTGLLAEHKNVSQLVSAAGRLIQDQPLRKRLAQKARHEAVCRFDLKYITEQYEKLYFEILQKEAQSPKQPKHFIMSELPAMIKTPAFLDAERTKCQSDVKMKSEISPQQPVLIYQMGKVGSSTIKASLDAIGIPNVQLHFLAENTIKEAETHFRKTGRTHMPEHLSLSKLWRGRIDAGRGKTRWKVVTLVRELVDQAVSAFFENLTPKALAEYSRMPLDEAVDKLIQQRLDYFRGFEEKRSASAIWFDREIKQVFDFDVFAHPFDPSKGYQIYHVNDADILLLRLESLDQCAGQAFAEFLGLENFRLIKTNVSRQKVYQDLHRRFLERFSLPESDLDGVYRARISTHFYANDEIQQFRNRWSQARVNTPQQEKPGHIGPSTLPQKQWPKISIVTPSFNQAKYLEQCIQSVLNQDYPNFEYIVMDGGSTDGSVEIIKKYAKHLKYWQSQPDGGQYQAVEQGFRHTDGQIMTWLNSDDKFHPGAFKKAAAIFMNRPDVEWITCRPNDFREDGTQAGIREDLPLWSRRRYLNKQYKFPFIQQEGSFWRRGLWEKAGAYMSKDLDLAGDLELWIRFFRHAQLHTVDALLAGYRYQPNQKAQLYLDEYIAECEKTLDTEIAAFHRGKNTKLLPAPEPILAGQVQACVDAMESNNAIPSRQIQEVTSGPSDRPLVSAIVSTYKSERFIEGGLQDLVDQTLFKKGLLEIVVVDSNSPENEGAMVRQFQQQYPNIKYIRTPQRETIYKAWNRGIQASAGKYITNANTDDRHHPQMLERLAAELEHNPDIALVYNHTYVTHVPNQSWQDKTPNHIADWHPQYSRDELLKRFYFGAQPMWRRSLHDEYGWFDESFNVAGDYEWALRITQTHKCKLIPEALGLYYYSEDSLERAAGTVDAENRRIWLRYQTNEDRIIRKPYRPQSYDFAVVMRNFNKAKYIAEAIESIQKQTFRNWQLVIVDDCSSDNSTDVIEKYLSDPRITLIRHESNRGVSTAARTGIANIDAPIFGIFDSDDYLEPDALEVMHRAHVENPDKGFIYSQFVYCDENLTIERPGYSAPIPQGRSNLELDCAAAFRTFKLDDYLKTDGHDTSLLYAEDMDIMYKMEEVTDFLFVDKPLYRYRITQDGHALDAKRLFTAKLAHGKAKINAIFRRSEPVAKRYNKDSRELAAKMVAGFRQESDKISMYMQALEGMHPVLTQHCQVPDEVRQAGVQAVVLWLAENLPFDEFHRATEKYIIVQDKTKPADETKPKFSVIVRNHNKACFIDEALQCLRDQTFLNWECIIVDDASTDNSLEVIQPWLKDKRFKLVRHEQQKGVSAAALTGIECVQSEFFGMLDSDDWLEPQTLEFMHKAHTDHPECGFIYSQFVKCDEKLNPTEMGFAGPIPPGATNLDVDKASAFRTFKLADYKKTTGHNTDLPAAEDKDIIYKMEEISGLFFVDKPLYRYRNLPIENVGNHLRMDTIRAMAHGRAKFDAYRRRCREHEFEQVIAQKLKSDPVLEQYYRALEQCHQKLLDQPQPDDFESWTSASRLIWLADRISTNELTECIRDQVLVHLNPPASAPHFGRTPRFTVVMRNYNKQQYIRQAMQSVINQTFTDWELIVVDDHSTDDSLKIANEIMHTDGRIRIVQHGDNLGVSAAARTGIEQVRAPYFGILDSDDCLEPDALQDMHDAHAHHPECGYIYSQFMICDENLQPTQQGFCRAIPPNQSNLQLDCASHFNTFKTADYKRTSGYDIDLPCAEDKDIVYKMEEVADTHFIDKCLYRYRNSPTGFSQDPEKVAMSIMGRARAKIRALRRRSAQVARAKNQDADTLFQTWLQRAQQTDTDIQKLFQALQTCKDTLFFKLSLPQEVHGFSYEQKLLYLAEHVPFMQVFELLRTPAPPQKAPLVTIYTVAYNTERYIAEAIESVLAQTFEDFEYIIIDDGSTDQTAQIAKNYNDPRIRFISQPHKNFAAGMNRAIREANGQFVLGIDSDDFIPPDYLEKLVTCAQQNSQVDYFYPARLSLIDEQGRQTGVNWDYLDFSDNTKLPAFLFYNGFSPIPNSGSLKRRSLFQRTGLFTELDTIEDFDFICRNATQIRFKRVDDASPYFYRRLENTNTGRFDLRNQITAQVLDAMIEEYPPDVLWPDMPPHAPDMIHQYAAHCFERLAEVNSNRHGEIFCQYAEKHEAVARQVMTTPAAAPKPDLSNPNRLRQRFQQGIDHLRASRPSEALQSFTRIQEIEPNQPNVRYARAVALAKLNRFDEAIAACDAEMGMNPQNQDAMNLKRQLQSRKIPG